MSKTIVREYFELKEPYLLYQNWVKKSGLFEFSPLSEQEFTHKYKDSVILFKQRNRVSAFAIYSREESCLVIRALIGKDVPQTQAAYVDEWISAIEGHFLDVRRIQYLLPDSSGSLFQHISKAGYQEGPKRLRMLRMMDDSPDSFEYGPEFSVDSYRIPEDRERLRWIMNAAFQDVWNHVDISEETILRWENEPNFNPEGYLFLRRGSETIGFVAVTVDPTRSYGGGLVATLHEIGILPAYRGRGLPAYLMGNANNFAKQRGASCIFLTVDGSNHSAVRFYLDKEHFSLLYALQTFFKDQKA